MVKRLLLFPYVVSPYHVLGALSYIESHGLDYYNKIIFIIEDYWGRSVIPDRYLEVLKHYNIEVLSKDRRNVVISDLKNTVFDEVHVASVNKPLYKIVFLLNFNLYRKIKFITIEDGVGAYASSFHIMKAMLREKKEKKYISFLKMVMSPCLAFFFPKFFRVDDFRLFVFNKKECFVNEIYKDNFIQVLNKIRINNPLLIKIDKPVVVFCSQPYYDMGVIDKNQYDKLISSLQKYCDERKYLFLIKKHPSEYAYEYNKEDLLMFDGCMEELFNQDFSYHIKGVIGFNSTCLLTVPAIFGTKAHMLDLATNHAIISSCGKKVHDLFNTYTTFLKI
ncbi:polysialyltransferase family glycosyltransferase [Pectobacterium parvum]|uniref:polysialyltransferase family glycosyltransferase n=1 Tax=Pectobacterium parvum TaxID=2778550 RepID=UPI003018B26F